MRGGVWLAWAVGFLLVALVGSVALAADVGTADATPPPPQPASDGGVKDSTRDEPASAAARTPPKAPKPSAEVNYAAVSAGAVVLGASPGMVGTKSLLDDDKDKYARAQCDQEKYVIVNLSEDIKVETIVMANYEKFSSSVKEFEVLYSTVLPQNGDEWHTLGRFTATSKQGAQRFTVESPKYARYLKFQWISHWGDEFYCTMSQIKVHGKTLQESFQRDYEEQRQNTMNHLQALKPDETSSELESKALQSEEEVRVAAMSIVTAVTKETHSSLETTSCDTAGAEEGGRGEKPDVHGPESGSGSGSVGVDRRNEGEQQDSSILDVTTGEAVDDDGESPLVCGAVVEGSTSSDGPAAAESTVRPGVLTSDEEVAAQRRDTASAMGEPPPRLCSERMAEEGGGGVSGVEGESSSNDVPSQAHNVPSQAQQGVEGLERVNSGVRSMGRGDVVQQPHDAQGREETSTDAVAPRRAQGGTERKECAAPSATEQPPNTPRCGSVKVEPPTAPQVGSEEGRDERHHGVETGSDGGQSPDSSRGAVRGGANDVHAAPSVLRPVAEEVDGLAADLPIGKPTSTTTVEPCKAEEPVGAAGENVGETGATEQEVEERSTCPIKGKPKAASSSEKDGKTVDTACQPPEVEGRDAVIVDGDALRAAEANTSSAARVPQDAAKAPADTPVASGKDSPHIPPSTTKQAPADKSVATQPPPGSPSPTAATQVASDSEPAKSPAQVHTLSSSSSSSSAGGGSLDSPAVVTRSGGAVEGAASNTTPLASAAAAAAQPSVVKVRRCLEQLAFPEFKKQKLGKLKEDGSKRGPAMGGAGSSPYDSIFKTLMVEITSQEINQSIFDMYVSQLQQCMAQALDDIRADRDRDRVAHEEAMRLLSNRVLNLSEANEQLSVRLVQLENSLLVSAAAWLVCMLAVILLLLGWCVRAAVRKHL